MNWAEAAKLIAEDPASAARSARDALALNPSDVEAYRLLGASLRRLGEVDEANVAELKAIELSGADMDLVRAVEALRSRDFATSEAILRAILAARPNDVLAIQTLGEVAAAAGLLEEAEALHRRALSLAPGFEYARLHLANVLNSQGRHGEALPELKLITGEILQFEGFKTLFADVLGQVGECDEAIELCREIVGANPSNLDTWCRLAFLCKAIGKPAEAIRTCRAALDIFPASGKLWWALASLRTYRFSDDDVDALNRALAKSVEEDDRARLHFALGKALEDGKDIQSSFAHFRRGNALCAARLNYRPDALADLLRRTRAVFSREFLDSRAGAGELSSDPIFIVGMPRAGSTLIEQILASHPLIEGTAELPDIHVLALSLAPDRRLGPRSIRYLDQLPMLADGRLLELGRLYLERTRVQRKTDRPFFVDKLPSNWANVGFIKLILPNAKIIDVRRHPLACGLSNYKQLFGRGQEFAYDLAHIGAYYQCYLATMAHFDAIASGTVHRVIYEQLIADPEAQIRRLLDFIGVPFEEACVRFHETRRPVRTVSAEQVRQPLRADYLDQWKVFEAELAPLKRALGPALEHWDDPQPQ